MTRFIKSFVILAAIAAPHLSNAGELIPFTLPWDDDAAGITDFSNLNHKPAGKFGSMRVDSNAHFSVGDQRIRLLGVNITASSCFPTHDEAEKIASRLAKFGFNVVRFHHMDNNWGSGSIIDYAKGNSRTLHTGNLERLDYFIAQLKANGIYVNINLINSREFQPSDGLDAGISALDWKERHVLGFVDETFRNLEKEYATNLLTHVNPYTELAYAADPAIAVVEINNENGIYQQYFDGSLDIWPSVYKTQLHDGWNEWLQAKYASTSAMLAAWSGESVPLGDQLIENPNFENSISPWNLEQHEGAVANATVGTFDQRQGVRIQTTTPGGAGWHIQINQGGKTLVKDNLYTLTFWVKSDTATSVSATIGLAYDPWSGVHSFPGITVTPQWQEKKILFNAGVSDTNLRLNFNGFATSLGSLYLSGVTIQEGGSLEASLPDGESLEAGNISNNLRSESYLANRALDWTRYLASIATGYWTDMRDHVKTTIGFQGLVNGSTIMNSPPNIQGVFDFADTHAYWQHPVFPGTAWDPNNWTINQVSMVNTLNNNVADLARQRIKGLPHTVSEYRHSYPNVYASEGPLLISAYAAMQDWDGIYFFDYAKGDSWDQGFFDNYFNMNAHPSSMANAIIAANLFRRSDVSESNSELLMNFSPEREIEAITTGGRAWNVGDGRQLGIQPAHALVQKIALSIGENAEGIETDPPAPTATGPVYSANEGELAWDLTTQEKGVVTIDTDRTKAIVGFINNRDFQLGNVSIEFGDTQEDWATVALTMREGNFINRVSNAKLLIVATGLTENTNMIWTDESKSSVGQNWGEAPSVVEAIPATITLPFRADRAQAWSLDETGQRATELAITASGENSVIEIGGSVKSLWYEVAISGDPSATPYYAWTYEHFSEEQRADDAISGPLADPDGDGIANLMEFLLLQNPNEYQAGSFIEQTVEHIENESVIVFSFLMNKNFGYDNLELIISENFKDWTTHALGENKVTYTVNELVSGQVQIRIEYRPTTFPVYMQLKASSSAEL